MSDPESWSPCPSGEFARMQESLRRQGEKLRARRRFLALGGVALAATGGYVTLSFVKTPTPPGAAPAPISCREVHNLMTAYHDGTLNSPSQRSSIQAHLAGCPRCKEFYEANA